MAGPWLWKWEKEELRSRFVGLGGMVCKDATGLPSASDILGGLV
jgi:hypothetical protein